MTAEVERVVAQVLTAARVEDVRQAIAQAIADTRQPFLDLADRIAEQATPLRSAPEATARWHGLALSEIATRIRDAAGDPRDPA